MAYTTADLTALQTALASGELQVRIDDKHVIYRSIDELQKAIAIVSDALNSTARPRYSVAFMDKG